MVSKQHSIDLHRSLLSSLLVLLLLVVVLSVRERRAGCGRRELELYYSV